MAKSHRICSVEGCGKSAHRNDGGARGWCSLHYMRWYRNGDPLLNLNPRQVPVCVVEGCGKGTKHSAQGMCGAHYQRWLKRGTAEPGRTTPGALLEWLTKSANWSGEECLIWPFYRGSNGYGYVRYRNTGMSASRAMCIEAHGEPPSNEHEAAHLCGGGHLGCVHPDHLAWKTKDENEADKIDHGTLIRGEEVWISKLTADDVRMIRASVGVSQKALARQYGVARATIGDVLSRRTWDWL